MNSAQSSGRPLWKEAPLIWGVLAISVALLCFLFWDGLVAMESKWQGSEEYGYGYIIPFLAVFMVWQKKNDLADIEFTSSWIGVLITLVGLFILIVGELSTLITIVQYAFLVTLFGVVYAYVGGKAMKFLWVPLFFLIFMVPLPSFLYQSLSATLQLISSELGVAVIRGFGISVFLEGNVIDLGIYKLQVVEACSGLRYLFPLACLAFMTAYFFSAPLWMRAFVFVSSIPITVIMNSFRIGVIGILVEYWGPSMAEGFLHDFEGWIVFMACISLLVLEMWLLNLIFRMKPSFAEVFSVDLPDPYPEEQTFQSRALRFSSVIGVVLISVFIVWAQAIDVREEHTPEHKGFASFPKNIEGWKGVGQQMEQVYIDVLKFDDYIMQDFVGESGQKVNLYVAYYASQRKGESAHSPRSCLPGGGWKIESLKPVEIEGVSLNGKSVFVNRTVITQGEYTQLVYYWFQQRSRNLTNEYLVKWYLLWDSIMDNRSDGSLVRLISFLEPGQTLDELDGQMAGFMQDTFPVLDPYFPD